MPCDWYLHQETRYTEYKLVYLVGSENEYQFYSRFLQATHTDAQVTTQGGASTISSQVLEDT